MPALVDQKRSLANQLRKDKYTDLVDFYGTDYLHCDAQFVDARAVAVGDRRPRAFRFLIATGAETWMLAVFPEMLGSGRLLAGVRVPWSPRSRLHIAHLRPSDA